MSHSRLSLANNAINFLAGLATFMTTVPSFLGLASSGGAADFGILGALGTASLPLRMIFFVAGAAGMGQLFGVIFGHLSRHPHEIGAYLGHVFGFLWAALLVGLGQFLFRRGPAGAPVDEVMLIFGLVLGLTVARIALKTRHAATNDVVAVRAGLLGTVTLSACFVLLLVNFGS